MRSDGRTLRRKRIESGVQAAICGIIALILRQKVPGVYCADASAPGVKKMLIDQRQVIIA